MDMLHERIALLSEPHREALNWFLTRAGSEVPWPEPQSSGLFLLNKAKGIHKPSSWIHALSVRQSMDSPYADRELIRNDDGTWEYDYYQEGHDPSNRDNDYTNKALMQNLYDDVPVAVVMQVKRKPNPLYLVVGLAKVTEWAGGYFHLRGYAKDGTLSPSLERNSTDIIVQAVSTEPIDMTDARKRANAAIVARQGAGAYRAQALRAFNGRCAITGCDIAQVLEAAHILPYRGPATNSLNNTLILRADMHTLFDRGLLTICPESLRVEFSDSLESSYYSSFKNAVISLPAGDPQPWKMALAQRASLAKVTN